MATTTTTTATCTACLTAKPFIFRGMCSGCFAEHSHSERDDAATDHEEDFSSHPACKCGADATCKGICFRCAYWGPKLHGVFAT
jgi:hypothetical protein